MLCEFDTHPALRVLKSSFLVKLGQSAYDGYLLHVIVFAALERLRLIPNACFLLVAYPTVWAAALTENRVFGRPSQRWFRSWLERVLGASASEFRQPLLK